MNISISLFRFLIFLPFTFNIFYNLLLAQPINEEICTARLKYLTYILEKRISIEKGIKKITQENSNIDIYLIGYHHMEAIDSDKIIQEFKKNIPIKKLCIFQEAPEDTIYNSDDFYGLRVFGVEDPKLYKKYSTNLGSLSDYRELEQERNIKIAENIKKYFDKKKCKRAFMFIGKSHINPHKPNNLGKLLRDKGFKIYLAISISDKSTPIFGDNPILNWETCPNPEIIEKLHYSKENYFLINNKDFSPLIPLYETYKSNSTAEYWQDYNSVFVFYNKNYEVYKKY